MRRLSITPNKKIQRQINDNKLAYLINSLFLSSPPTFAPQSTNTFSHGNPKTARITSSRQQTQIQFEHKNPSLVISKNIPIRSQNQPSSLAHSDSKSSNRPKTSLPYGSNSNYNTIKNQDSAERRRGLSSGFASRDYKGKSSMKKTEGLKESIEPKEEIRIEYTLAEPESLIQRSGNKPSKSISSTKSIGIVKGYSVNSHKFFIHPSQHSEARICIIANITKITSKQRFISFYSIFETTSSSPAYLDYLRENFCQQITPYLSSVPVPPITPQLIETCLRNTQKKYLDTFRPYTTRQRQTSSLSPNKSIKSRMNLSKDVSFAMAFVRNKEVTICLKGDTYALISTNFGSKIFRLTYSSLKEEGNQSVRVKIFSKDETNNFDYLTLASNGVYSSNLVNSSNLNESNKICLGGMGHMNSQKKVSGWLHRQIWLSIITQITQATEQLQINSSETSLKLTIHQILSVAVDYLMNLYVTSLSSKNISILCLGFENIQNLLKNQELVQRELTLDRIDKGCLSSQTRLTNLKGQPSEQQYSSIFSNLQLPFTCENNWADDAKIDKTEEKQFQECPI